MWVWHFEDANRVKDFNGIVKINISMHVYTEWCVFYWGYMYALTQLVWISTFSALCDNAIAKQWQAIHIIGNLCLEPICFANIFSAISHIWFHSYCNSFVIDWHDINQFILVETYFRFCDFVPLRISRIRLTTSIII